MIHQCVQKFKTRKADHCTGKGTNKCSGIENMILEVWYADTNGQEETFDNWMLVSVNFCPFCGLKSQPERSKREDLYCVQCDNIKERVHSEISSHTPMWFYDYLDEDKMRCSEHCGNTVRKVQ